MNRFCLLLILNLLFDYTYRLYIRVKRNDVGDYPTIGTNQPLFLPSWQDLLIIAERLKQGDSVT
jgi:hypothetical protein